MLYNSIGIFCPKGDLHMPANKGRYTSVPLMNLKDNPIERPHVDEPPTFEAEKKRPEKLKRYTVLQLILTVALPILFLCALFIVSMPLRLAFIAVALISVALMWILRAFTLNARKTLSLVYILLAVIIGFAMLLSSPLASTRQTVARVDTDSMFSKENVLDTVTMSDIESQLQTETPVPQATEIPVSAAEEKLREFMSAWSESDTNHMLALCTPSWVEQQDNAPSSLFKLLAIGINRPTGYRIENIGGSDTDMMRAIQTVVYLSTSGGDVARRYQIFLTRLNNEWYIDPASLNSIGIVTDENEVFGQQESMLTNATPSPTPLPTIDPNTTLYYNPDGGQAYHIDPYCKSAAPENLPFKGTFKYSELGETPYDVLNRCRYCKPPERK